LRDQVVDRKYWDVTLVLGLALMARRLAFHTLLDHAARELRERARHVEQHLAGWGGRVEVLLVEVEIDADGFEVFDYAQEIDKGAAEAVNGPSHDHVELPPTGALEHDVEARPLVPALGTLIPVSL
jgi:hypothetical protein